MKDLKLSTFEELQKKSVFFMLKPANAIYGFLLTICISLLVLIIWAFFAPMDDVVKASVILRPEEAVSSIRCVTGGELFIKNYVNDQVVTEGDLLLSLDSSAYKKELENYQLQLSVIEQDIFVNDTLIKTIKSETFPNIEKNSNAYLKSASYLYEKQRQEYIMTDCQNQLEIEKNKPDFMTVPQTVKDLESKLSQIQLSFFTWKNDVLSEALSLQQQLNSSKKSIESKIAELNRYIKNSTIYAPISGRITESLKLNIGDYILTGEEILKIVPESSTTLKASLLIDPAFIARVKVGNSVKIRFLGLPPSRYGQIETNISLIPPDVDISTGTPIFIAEAPIPKDFLVSSDGQIANLIPGITAEAKISTEKTTVMKMLLRKLDFIN